MNLPCMVPTPYWTKRNELGGVWKFLKCRKYIRDAQLKERASRRKVHAKVKSHIFYHLFRDHWWWKYAYAYAYDAFWRLKYLNQKELLAPCVYAAHHRRRCAHAVHPSAQRHEKQSRFRPFMSESLEPNYETEKSKDLSHHRILTGRLITTADLCTQFIEEFSENGVIKYMVQLVRDDNLALSRCVNMRVGVTPVWGKR